MTQRDLPIKTFAIIVRGRKPNDHTTDIEKCRVDAHSSDHACWLAESQHNIDQRTITQAINIASPLYQRFLKEAR